MITKSMPVRRSRSTAEMRTRADRMMAVGGLLVIFLQTLFIASKPIDFAVIFAGILLVAAALWGLGRRLAQERRVHLQLRAEVDHFADLARKMNAHAVAGEGKRASATKTQMHESVDRIALVAGVVGSTENLTEQITA